MKLSIEQKKIMDNCFPFAGKAIPLNESQRQCMFAAGEALLDQQAVALTDAQWKALSDDIADRRGLKWEWGKIDDDVKLEIRAAWSKILAQRTPEPAPAPVGVLIDSEPPREEGKHRFLGGTCVDCGHPLDDICAANLLLQEEKLNETQSDVRMVRPVDRSVLGQEESRLVPLPITDDRPPCPVDVDAPAPMCPHCGPVCYGGAAHNARAEDGVMYAPAPQSTDEETVERMWNIVHPHTEPLPSDIAQMTAALTEARRGLYSAGEIEKAMRDTPELGNPARNYKDVDRLIKRVLARLSAKEQP